VTGSLLFCLLSLANGWKAPSKFLLISSPQNGTIGYIKLSQRTNISRDEVTPLISDGLHHPQGIAVDQKRHRLLVADPDLGKLVAYSLRLSSNQVAVEGEPAVVADGVSPRWVAVDGRGNVFFSEEGEDQILTVPADAEGTAPKLVYAGDAPVRAPGGIASDNFFVYWINKEEGTSSGLVVRGSQYDGSSNNASELASLTSVRSEDEGATLKPTVLSSATSKGYGVCVARDILFFTADSQEVYQVSRDPAAPSLAQQQSGSEKANLVTNQLVSPRGCAFDGQENVYVADRSTNAVYAFPATSGIVQTSLVQLVEYEGAFGLAVVSGGTYRICMRLVWAIILLCTWRMSC